MTPVLLSLLPVAMLLIILLWPGLVTAGAEPEVGIMPPIPRPPRPWMLLLMMLEPVEFKDADRAARWCWNSSMG